MYVCIYIYINIPLRPTLYYSFFITLDYIYYIYVETGRIFA